MLNLTPRSDLVMRNCTSFPRIRVQQKTPLRDDVIKILVQRNYLIADRNKLARSFEWWQGNKRLRCYHFLLVKWIKRTKQTEIMRIRNVERSKTSYSSLWNVNLRVKSDYSQLLKRHCCHLQKQWKMLFVVDKVHFNCCHVLCLNERVTLTTRVRRKTTHKLFSFHSHDLRPYYHFSSQNRVNYLKAKCDICQNKKINQFHK